MSNFSFLQHEFQVLQSDSVKSESNVLDDPEVSGIYVRKALENSIKFVYRVDEDLDEKLISMKTLDLINHNNFKDIVPAEMIDELHYIRMLGNKAVHTSHTPISSKDTLYANKCLYKFQRWIVEVYSDYEVTGDYDVLKIASGDKEEKQKVIEQTEQEQKLEA